MNDRMIPKFHDKEIPLGYVIPWREDLLSCGFIETKGQVLLRSDYPDLYEAFLYNPYALDFIIDEKSFCVPAIKDALIKAFNFKLYLV